MTIEGLEHLEKDGWELIAFREASEGEYFVNNEGKIEKWTLGRKSGVRLVIIRRIEKPKQYRPFANAAEFKPFRDRWWVLKNDEHNQRRCPTDYDDLGYADLLWRDMLEDATFDDGTPFGVEVQS